MNLRNNKFNIAFTLIELLVVIAIVGILSGLIIVGMNSSVRSATIAKAQIFSASLRDSLLMNLVSEWKFDDGTGSTAIDSWSGGNNGTLKENGYVGSCDATHCPQWQGAGCIYGNCLSLDGVNDYVDCGNGANLNITNVLTIEAWMKLQPTASLQVLIDKTWSNGYSILINSGFVSVYYSGGGSPNYYNLSTPTVVFNWGDWTYVTYTFTTSLAKIYINGVQKASKVPEGNIAISGANLKIGVDSSGGSYYVKGLVDGVRIYNAAIPASQIKERYYAGINRLLAKGGITKKDYQNRLSELGTILAKIN